MARFLIEVPHEADGRECALAVEILYKTGSHWLTHAEWGCLDGDHKAWLGRNLIHSSPLGVKTSPKVFQVALDFFFRPMSG